MSSNVVPLTDKDTDELVKDTKSFFDKAMGDVAKSSNYKQLLLGTASGWVTGYVGMKVGKLASIGIGTGIILSHLAYQNEIVSINWDKIQKKSAEICSKVEDEKEKHSTWLSKVLEFMKHKTYFSAGFAGGVFLGIAYS